MVVVLQVPALSHRASRELSKDHGGSRQGALTCGLGSLQALRGWAISAGPNGLWRTEGQPPMCPCIRILTLTVVPRHYQTRGPFWHPCLT